MNNHNIILATDLNKTFDALQVVKGVSLSVKVGEFISIVGKSGSGKTTLLSLLSGLERPSSGRVTLNAPVHKELKRSLLKHIRAAERRVWIATAYFIPSRRLRRTLRRQARQGVDVRLLLPGPITDHPGVRYASQRYYAPLLRDGVRIFEYLPRFNHTKLAVCDDWVSIGSSNFDRWNLRRNLEANQEVEDRALADQAVALLLADLDEAREMGPAERWRRRPLYLRLREWFWSAVTEPRGSATPRRSRTGRSCLPSGSTRSTWACPGAPGRARRSMPPRTLPAMRSSWARWSAGWVT